jgi:hypothetical protein
MSYFGGTSDSTLNVNRAKQNDPDAGPVFVEVSAPNGWDTFREKLAAR